MRPVKDGIHALWLVAFRGALGDVVTVAGIGLAEYAVRLVPIQGYRRANCRWPGSQSHYGPGRSQRLLGEPA